MERVLAVLLAALALLSCTTSKGSLFRDTVETEGGQSTVASADQEPLEAVEEEEQWEPAYYEQTEAATKAAKGLEILSDPERANVYLDGRYVGTTPLLLPGLPAGRYSLTLTKDGFYPSSTWISHFSDYSVYNLSLSRITGFLRVEVQPPEALVSIDSGSYESGRVHQLAVGRYTVRARSFGYEEHTETVVIRERELTELAIVLPEAEFTVGDLRSNRERFNPRNPGALGSVRLSFEVSSFGSGTAVIVNASEQEVYRAAFERFTAWNQELSWDGRGKAGETVPDGLYTVVLRAVGEGDGTEFERRRVVGVDSSLVLAYRSLLSGSAGLLYAPAPEVLPAGGFQLSTLVLAHSESAGADALVRVPVVLGSRWGMGGGLADASGGAPFTRWELDIQAGSIVGYANSQGEESLTFPFFASAALKTLLLRPTGAAGFASSLQAKLAYQAVSTDTLANSTGFSIGIPCALRLGSAALLLEPELIVSPWRVSYDPAAPRQADFYIWSYTRVGLLVDLGVLSAGLSVSTRTLPFTEGFDLELPFQGAVELHWLIPRTPLFVSLVFAGELSPPESYYLQGGAGLGLLH